MTKKNLNENQLTDFQKLNIINIYRLIGQSIDEAFCEKEKYYYYTFLREWWIV